MPVHKIERVHNTLIWGLWEISETRDELLDNLELDQDLEFMISKAKNKQKILESIASRKLIEELAFFINANYEGIYKNEHGEPFLINSLSHISISHSFPYVAASLNTSVPTGIDLEHYNEKVIRIEHKFLSEQELFDANHDLKKLILLWAAKEALYKVYGRKQLSAVPGRD